MLPKRSLLNSVFGICAENRGVEKRSDFKGAGLPPSRHRDAPRSFSVAAHDPAALSKHVNAWIQHQHGYDQ